VLDSRTVTSFSNGKYLVWDVRGRVDVVFIANVGNAVLSGIFFSTPSQGMMDTDGDGLADYLEDANGNGAYGAGDPSDWKVSSTDGTRMSDGWEMQYFGHIGNEPKADPDYDGRNNLQESQESTNPNDANSYAAVQLANLTFDNTNTWVGVQGQLPIASLNVLGQPSPRTNAVSIYSTNGAYLTYRDVETNGLANFNCRRGTLRFWFKPDWSSASAGGSGPQANGQMFSLGSWTFEGTYGWWGLTLWPDGRNISFLTQGTQEGDGYGTEHFAPAINWYSNTWHQVVLTYSTNATKIYLDG